MEMKVVPLFTFNVEDGEAQGIVETVFAVFGNIDQGGDMMHPGSFTKTFQMRANRIRILDQHKTDSVMRALGRPLELKELSRNELPPEVLEEYPEATGGAYAKIQFLMNTPEGAGAFERIRTGAISEWSFGYDAIQKESETIGGRQVRHLREVKLYELGPVLFGMNEATTTISAKSNEEPDTEEEKGAVPYQNIPLASRTRAWNATAAGNRVRGWAGYDADDEDAISWSRYRRAFFWYDASNADQFGSYKLPYADIVNGELTAIPRAIFAAAAAVQGARSPLSIPDADQGRIRTTISRWYGRMRDEFDDDSIVPSWEKAEPVAHLDAKAYNLSAHVRMCTTSFYAAYPDIHSETRDGARLIYYVEEVYDSFVVVRQEGNQEGNGLWRVDYTIEDNQIEFASRDDWIAGHRPFVTFRQGYDVSSSDGKAGRILSQRNANRLAQAVQVLTEVLTDAGYIDAPDNDDEQETNDGTGPQDAPIPSQADVDASPEDLLKVIAVQQAEINYALVD